MNRTLITGFAIIGSTIIAASASAQDGKEECVKRFVSTFKGCIARHAEKSPKVAECYLQSDLTYWCPTGVEKSIPDGCTTEANASARPARKAGY